MNTLSRVAVAAVVLACLACGGKRTAAKAVASVPAEAFAPLTEDDVARFVRALPAVVEHVNWRRTPRDEELRVRDDAAKVLAATIEWLPAVEGIDSVFAANGVDWPFFRAMLYRLAVCAWSVGMDQTEEQSKRLIRSQPTGAIAHAMRKRLRQMREIAAAVPAANLEVFHRHYRELRPFFAIVDYD
jgi:hypothetical protein